MVERTGPLDALHRALGAKMVPFGGWVMPLAYPGGTVAEHLACREAAVAFDVSHLGTVRVTGPAAARHLNTLFTNDLGRIGPGKAQYTHLLDERDASVLDDIIVWWTAEDELDVMPNASNTERVLAAIGQGRDVMANDVTAERAVIAVQGPRARTLLESVAPDAARVPRFTVVSFAWKDRRCTAAGTGYTGEDGVECCIPADLAPSFWDEVMAAGVQPAGLGARDTLRLEAGLPLHGHELGPGITPLAAGLGWVVSWDKGPFQGRAALEAERTRGPARRLRGIVTEGRQPPREGNPVLAERDGTLLGNVTSGNFSPVLGRGIALALVDRQVEPGDAVMLDIRGRRVRGAVVVPPFVHRRAS